MHDLTLAALAVGMTAGENNGQALSHMLGLPDDEAKQVAAEALQIAFESAGTPSDAPRMDTVIYALRRGIELGIAAERRVSRINAGAPQ